MGKKLFLLAIFFCVFGSLQSQEHPILEDFQAFSNNETILLSWTIRSGSTCNGIDIERSTDSTIFGEIGRIEGVCGSLSSPVQYTFEDLAPLKNTRNYYRLKLGNQGYSSVVDADNYELKEDGYLLFPNPVASAASLVFENKRNEPYQLMLYSRAGALVLVKAGQQGNRIDLSVEELPKGINLFVIQKETGKKIAGKLLVL